MKLRNWLLHSVAALAFLAAASLPAKHHHEDTAADAALQAAPAPGYAIHIDLGRLLAPPPANDSAQTKAEIEEVLKFQKERTMADEAAINADQEYSVFRFADVMGGKFNQAALPKTAALFEKVVGTSQGMVNSTKDLWHRPRPFMIDSRVMPSAKKSKSSSYPSGHATAGTVMAIVLSNLVPEKSADIFARGWLFALHRVMGGVHHRSDIEAGRIAGTALASQLFNDPEFTKDFEAAKAELRPALGYP